MKLIRRKKEPTHAEQALGYARLVVRGLVALRVARNAHKSYRFARKLPLIGAGFVATTLLLKKLAGRKQDASEAQWTPPSTAQTPASPSVPTPAAPAPNGGSPATAAATPPPVETASTGTPPADLEPEPPAAPTVDPAVGDEPAGTATGVGDGPELTTEGGDIAPELEGSDATKKDEA